MELLSTAEFLAWAGSHGVAWDPRYPRAHQLSYLAAPGIWTGWDVPAVGELGRFSAAILEVATAGGEDLVAFPRWEGRWYTDANGPLPNNVLDVITAGIGIPPGFVGAARFTAAERASLVAVTVASLVFGWGVGDDLYVVPASGTSLLMTEHDGQVSVRCPTAEGLEAFVAALAARGFPHPDFSERAV